MSNAICQKCGKQYQMGVNGVVEGCDECLGIERDKQGKLWRPGEKRQIRTNLTTGEFIIVTRKQAFGEEK